MNEVYEIITSDKVEKDWLKQPDWEYHEEIVFKNYRIKFNGIAEPNNGRLVLNFKLFCDGVNITKKINFAGYCLPVSFPFSEANHNFIYIPTENAIVLINSLSGQIHKIDYPEDNRIRHHFFYENFLIIVFQTGYMFVDLVTLTKRYRAERVDFVIPFGNKCLTFMDEFAMLRIEAFDNSGHTNRHFSFVETP